MTSIKAASHPGSGTASSSMKATRSVVAAARAARIGGTAPRRRRGRRVAPLGHAVPGHGPAPLHRAPPRWLCPAAGLVGTVRLEPVGRRGAASTARVGTVTDLEHPDAPGRMKLEASSRQSSRIYPNRRHRDRRSWREAPSSRASLRRPGTRRERSRTRGRPRPRVIVGHRVEEAPHGIGRSSLRVVGVTRAHRIARGDTSPPYTVRRAAIVARRGSATAPDPVPMSSITSGPISWPEQFAQRDRPLEA